MSSVQPAFLYDLLSNFFLFKDHLEIKVIFMSHFAKLCHLKFIFYRMQ